ncbi:hypothetical protein DPMN_174087 [Dreissena polymorpha]|uniref:Uncharacterized protein n=1 Tax=Dreissena polymorpha TaxID=45954 RepID=A0A9D4E6T7_DREPO|nr:hypothetical protein DPMN_174087 [Dreissena polymorpha]
MYPNFRLYNLYIRELFKLVQDILGKNLLTKFHDDRKINVASRVLSRKIAMPQHGHVFQPTGTIFYTNTGDTPFQSTLHLGLTSHVQRGIEPAISGLIRYKENALPPGGHVFQPIGIIFKLVENIIGKNLLTTFYEDPTINVASRVLTRQMLTTVHRQKVITKAHH